MRRGALLLLAMLLSPATVYAASVGLKQVPPDSLAKYFEYWGPFYYPRLALDFHKAGKGWFALRIDRATGRVREVKVLRSTGVKILDDSAAAALLQTRAKPYLLDHAVIPVEFRRYPRVPIGSHIAR